MKIWTLIENTTTNPDLTAEHGLSLYIETDRHRILFDSGQTGAFAANAQQMGLDLSQVDIAVLSHGHYDHGGGLPAFLELNSQAPVYLSRHAFVPCFNGTDKYIGLDQTLAQSDRLIFVDDELTIDDELTLYSCNQKRRPFPTDSFGLNMQEKDRLIPDDFRHEQYLMIRDKGRKILLSGCSHKGILNIMDWFRPDILIGSFHFMKLPTSGTGADTLRHAAGILMHHNTRYYTGHCTGTEQFAFLKEIMGTQLDHLTTGRSITI